jgi:TonB family protein
VISAVVLVGLLCSPALAQDEVPSQEEALPEPSEDTRPLVSMPELLEYVQAPYPEAAKEAEIEGTVRLLIEIDEAGEVTYIEVLQPAGNGFDEAAVAAAWQFYFTPAMDEDGPVPVAIEFDYGFILDVSTVEDAVPDVEEPPQDLPVNLEGTLTEKGTRRPLPEMPVLLLSPSGAQLDQTETDAAGRFAFRGAPLGQVALKVVYPEYEILQADIEVTPDEVADVDLWIRNLNYREDELVGVYQREREPEVTRRTITVNEMRRIPGTFGDPVRVIQSLPGAARAPFGTGGLIIRGANPEDTRVYVDGVLVPLVYHLGGIVSIVNSDLIEAVDYLPGGYSARYGRGMGGVVDIRTQEAPPEEGKLSWSTDLLDSGGLYQGQHGGWGVSVAARRSYIDAVLAPLSDQIGASLLPRWYDYQVKASPLSFDGGYFSVLVFGFQDRLSLVLPEDTATDTSGIFDNDFDTAYSSHRAVVRFDLDLTEKLALRTTSALSWDDAIFDITDDFRFSQKAPGVTVRAELPWQATEGVKLTPGLDFFGQKYDVEITLPFSEDQLRSFDPLAENESFSFGFSGVGYSPDLFLDAQIQPFGDRDRLLINPGIRWSTLRLDQNYFKTTWDPRLGARLRVIEGGYLKGGTGIYNQAPQGPDFGFSQENVTVGFEQSWSSEIGYTQQITPGLSADFTVFHRSISDRIVSNPAAEEDPAAAVFANLGGGRVNGMEVMVRQAAINNVFGWVSYTLSKAERNDTPEDDSTWYLFDFDQTHILVMLGGYRFPYDIGVSGRLQYVTGNPYSPLENGIYDIDQDSYVSFASGAQNSERQPDYFAIDARIDKLFTFKKWQLEVYLDLLNVVKGENPEDVQYNYDYTESTWVTGLPFLPSPGFNAQYHF